jgi:hypothetical protein
LRFGSNVQDQVMWIDLPWDWGSRIYTEVPALLFEQGVNTKSAKSKTLNQHDCGHPRDGKH